MKASFVENMSVAPHQGNRVNNAPAALIRSVRQWFGAQRERLTGQPGGADALQSTTSISSAAFTWRSIGR
jgi:hypothetical protein